MKVAPSSPGDVYLTIVIVGIGLLIQMAVSGSGAEVSPTDTFRIISSFVVVCALLTALILVL